jgi:hypothetical protein
MGSPLMMSRLEVLPLKSEKKGVLFYSTPGAEKVFLQIR